MHHIWPVGNLPESIITEKSTGLNMSLSNIMQLPRSSCFYPMINFNLIIDKVMVLNIKRLLTRIPCSLNFFKTSLLCLSLNNKSNNINTFKNT